MMFTLIITVVFLTAILVFFYYKNAETITDQRTQFPPKYLKVEGELIHYIQEGKGPHVVLLHGIGASSFTWRFMVAKLAKYYTVTVPDLLGFGLSAKPTKFSYSLDEQCQALDAIFKELGIGQARVIASSMGGAIALWYAKLHPEKILEIVALSPALDPGVLRFNAQRLKFLGPVVSPLVTRAFIKQIMKRVVNKPELITDEAVEAYYQPYARPEAVQSFLKSTNILRDKRLPAELTNLKTPTLMIWGAKDRIVPLSIGNSIKKKLPQIQFVTHPTAGHHIMEEEPDWLFEQVRAFFDTRLQ